MTGRAASWFGKAGVVAPNEWPGHQREEGWRTRGLRWEQPNVGRDGDGANRGRDHGIEEEMSLVASFSFYFPFLFSSK